MSDHMLHRWADSDGNEWACGVYDHGAFCRLCQPVDDVLAGCLGNVTEGNFEWFVDSHGGFSFKVTPRGVAQIDQLTADDPELRDLYQHVLDTGHLPEDPL